MPKELLMKLTMLFESGLPYTERGITITENLLKVTVELLNAAEGRILPQNARNASIENTPDGLDKCIKIALQSDTRTANIVSDELAKRGVVEITSIENPKTGNQIKATRLLPDWAW
jgi:cell envelope opacity-associated protein A